MRNLHRNHCAVALLSGSIDLFGIIQKENAPASQARNRGVAVLRIDDARLVGVFLKGAAQKLMRRSSRPA